MEEAKAVIAGLFALFAIYVCYLSFNLKDEKKKNTHNH